MIKLEIKGSKLNRFLKRLNDNNINVYKINKNIITVDEKDLEKINNIKTIYKIEIKEYVGFKKFIKNINYIFLICIFISIIFIYINSKIIYKINIITDDIEIKKLLEKELNKEGIKKHNFQKKNYDLIEKKIINKNKDDIEWLEIEGDGTTINVKVQTRIIKKDKENIKPRNIIAKKNAIIKKVEAESGDIIKENNVYVNKGDIIISGNVIFNEINIPVAAKGKVYGEVWYRVKTQVPYLEYINKKTKQKHKIIKINFLNNKYNLFKKSYENKSEDIIFSIKCLILPINISLIEETKILKQNIFPTENEIIEKAIIKSRKKIKNKLKEKEYIILEKQLKQTMFDSKIELEMFYSVYEDITDYSSIE